MSGYGTIDGFQAQESDDFSDHPQTHGGGGLLQSSSDTNRIQNLSSRPWFRAIVACSVAIVIAIVSHSDHSIRETHHESSESTIPSTEDNIKKGFDYNKDHNENTPLFYNDQLLNHFSPDTTTWSNRYYATTHNFRGPGHPIILIVGGESSLNGMLYPFVTKHLAPTLGAAVISIEHRFYGPYQPMGITKEGRSKASVKELVELLTPQQAMADMIRLLKVYKKEVGCGEYGSGEEMYCPVITVGGSYPGVLSALFRLVYPEFIDISYASSAPLIMHAQQANQNAFYDIVTKAAERTSKGCNTAVLTALEETQTLIKQSSSVTEAVTSMNMCADTIPKYINNDDLETLNEDIMMAIAFTFANYDMEAYPPSKELELYKSCRIFQDTSTNSSLTKVANFFQLLKDTGSELEFPGLKDRDCFDLSVFLPDGDNPRIATSDWTGAGGGNDGMMWDFQLCTTLVVPIGFSKESMFPTREWTLEGLTHYCQLRYGKEVTPQPYALVNDLGFDDLIGNGASRILFTNGLQDLWSGGSHLEDVSESILALNFENGAHHSDLTHVGPSEHDTEDIKEGFVTITGILQKWLEEIREES